MNSGVVTLVDRIETIIIGVLLILLAIVLAVGTGQLVVTVVLGAVHHWNTGRSIDELGELREVFSGFLLILIGLELMKNGSAFTSCSTWSMSRSS